LYELWAGYAIIPQLVIRAGAKSAKLSAKGMDIFGSDTMRIIEVKI
jgi:hypothetical protein